MNNIQIKEINTIFNQVVLEDVQYLKRHLHNVLSSSDHTLIKNLIEETELLLEQAKDSSRTYHEKQVALTKITESWFEVWNRYKTIPEAIDFIRKIDHFTNYSLAYSYLLLSLTLINEGRVGDYRVDLERIVSGFLLLSEIVDIFIGFFSLPELNQIYDGARNAISVSNRDVAEYFEADLKLSNLITQLRAYSSLIVLKVTEYLKKIEAILGDEDTQIENRVESSSSFIIWSEQISKAFATHSALKQREPNILRGDEEFEAIADRLADEFKLYSGATTPALSDYAVSRTGIYEEHP